MDFTKEWYRSEFLHHEEGPSHRTLENELSFYDAIALGNEELVRTNCKENAFTNPEGMGKLSDNPLQNMRYHFVVTTAMIIRYCMSHGLEQELAFGLSDFYIQKMDKCISIEEISSLHDSMCLEICERMKKVQKSQILSKPIVQCLDYIYSHIHYRITIQELSEHLKLSESYLSKLFHKEMGVPLSTYIMDVKIDKAKNLLRYSDYSITDIANYLSFSSQSHFIQVFQKKVGKTPHKYRVQSFKDDWISVYKTDSIKSED